MAHFIDRFRSLKKEYSAFPSKLRPMHSFLFFTQRKQIVTQNKTLSKQGPFRHKSIVKFRI